MRLAFSTVIVMSGIGGFRPGVLMGLKYSNVRLGLVRDPVDSSKLRLVAHVKIDHNKQQTKHVRHDQADTYVLLHLIGRYPSHVILISE